MAKVKQQVKKSSKGGNSRVHTIKASLCNENVPPSKLRPVKKTAKEEQKQFFNRLYKLITPILIDTIETTRMHIAKKALNALILILAETKNGRELGIKVTDEHIKAFWKNKFSNVVLDVVKKQFEETGKFTNPGKNSPSD